MAVSGNRTYLLAVLAVTMAAGACASIRGGTPGARQPAGRAPHEIQAERKLRKPPVLESSGDDVRQAVAVFVGWASSSTLGEREDVRRAVVAARANDDVVAALCAEAFAAQKHDHSRALVVLSLLGEMRSRAGEACLTRFMELPWPREGTKADGEILEQTALGTLQGKAIDGLAYMGSESADAEVLRAVAAHPSRIVRAEAINAYLWNHQDSAESRAVLAKSVRAGEEIFLDRPRRVPGQDKESFNRDLQEYLEKHRELVAPAPNAQRGYQGDSRQPAATEKPRTRPVGEPPPPR